MTLRRGDPVLILDLDRRGVVVSGQRHGFGMGWTYEVSLAEPMPDGGNMVKTVWRKESLLCRLNEPVPAQRTKPKLELVVDNHARFITP